MPAWSWWMASLGAQVGTEQVWRALDERNLPRLVVINKLDRENADFDRVLDLLRERYGKKIVPLTIPIGRENSFRGVVDLLTRTAHLGGADGASEVPTTRTRRWRRTASRWSRRSASWTMS